MAFLSSSSAAKHPGCTFGSPSPRAHPTLNRSSFLPAPPSNQLLRIQVYICTKRQSRNHGHRNFRLHRKILFGVDMFVTAATRAFEKCTRPSNAAAVPQLGIVTTDFNRTSPFTTRTLASYPHAGYCHFSLPSLICRYRNKSKTINSNAAKNCTGSHSLSIRRPVLISCST